METADQQFPWAWKRPIGSFSEDRNGQSVVSMKLTEIADCLWNGWTDLHLSISLALVTCICQNVIITREITLFLWHYVIHCITATSYDKHFCFWLPFIISEWMSELWFNVTPTHRSYRGIPRFKVSSKRDWSCDPWIGSLAFYPLQLLLFVIRETYLKDQYFLPCNWIPYSRGATLKEKNLLSERANSFL